MQEYMFFSDQEYGHSRTVMYEYAVSPRPVNGRTMDAAAIAVPPRPDQAFPRPLKPSHGLAEQSPAAKTQVRLGKAI
jgi:hypothetical protein